MSAGDRTRHIFLRPAEQQARARRRIAASRSRGDRRIGRSRGRNHPGSGRVGNRGRGRSLRRRIDGRRIHSRGSCRQSRSGSHRTIRSDRIGCHDIRGHRRDWSHGSDWSHRSTTRNRSALKLTGSDRNRGVRSDRAIGANNESRAVEAGLDPGVPVDGRLTTIVPDRTTLVASATGRAGERRTGELNEPGGSDEADGRNANHDRTLSVCGVVCRFGCRCRGWRWGERSLVRLLLRKSA